MSWGGERGDGWGSNGSNKINVVVQNKRHSQNSLTFDKCSIECHQASVLFQDSTRLFQYINSINTNHNRLNLIQHIQIKYMSPIYNT